MTETKVIKNEQWTVHQLREKIEHKQVMKDKYQRPKKWFVLPNSKQPSIQEYIDFLWDTQNSVHSITFGKNNNIYSNIDGNNRLNAIMNYLERPFEVYPQYLNDISIFVHKTYGESIHREIMDVFEALSYDDIVNFTYSKYFNGIGKTDLYNNHLKKFRDEWDDFYDGETGASGFVGKFMIKDVMKFSDVKINITLFEGYSPNERNDVYIRVNKHNGAFTTSEFQAGILYKTVDFDINDINVKNNINAELIAFYDKRSMGEKLNCYEHNVGSTMNAYDFLTGFQMVAHKKCDFIDDVDNNNNGLGLFFKLYKSIYKNLDDTFTTENVNEFIDIINKTIGILQKVYEQLFPDILVCVNKKASINKVKSLKKNNVYLIIAAIVGFINKNAHIAEIVKSIETCILYHLFVNDVTNTTDRELFRTYDTLSYRAGGGFIDNMAVKLLKNAEDISNKISCQKMENVIDVLLNEKVKNVPYEVRDTGRPKNDKRRQRTFIESIMILNYYKNKVPCECLSKTFWMEHIVPFSSDWSGIIDIDRLGNVIPIIDTINRKRGTKHINSYKKNAPPENIKFLSFIDDIMPSHEVYDTIVSHASTRPNVINADNYNLLCNTNETTYKKTFLKYLFPIV